MNRKIIVILLLTLTIIACNSNKITPKDAKIDNLDFEIEKIQFSKSFQNLNPFTEVLEQRGDRTQILISLGLTETSNLHIDRVLKNSSGLDIYVKCLNGDENEELSVPQAIISVESDELPEVNNMNINIIGEGYEELKVTLSQNDAISKTESLFKLTSTCAPKVTLEKVEDNIYWNVLYDMAFDKNEKFTPIYKYYAKINAIDGDIVQEEKKFIANSVDDGYILEYVENKLILYKKDILNDFNELVKEELWLYDINSGEKELIFSTKETISDVKFSPDNEYISFIKDKEKNSSVNIIKTKNSKIYKTPLKEDFNPKLSGWIDDNHLCLVEEVKGVSKIYSYDILNNELTFLRETSEQINSVISGFNKVLFTTKTDKSDNKNIYYVHDLENIELIGKGFHPRLVNSDELVYISDNEKTDYNIIRSYSFKDNVTTDLAKGLISNFQIISNSSIAFTDKLNNLNNYMLYSYNLNNKTNDNNIREISKTISSHSYYVPNLNSFFMNACLPDGENRQELFYLININKVR